MRKVTKQSLIYNWTSREKFRSKRKGAACCLCAQPIAMGQWMRFYGVYDDNGKNAWAHFDCFKAKSILKDLEILSEAV
jgi:hypothetical protein